MFVQNQIAAVRNPSLFFIFLNIRMLKVLKRSISLAVNKRPPGAFIKFLAEKRPEISMQLPQHDARG